MASLDKQRYQIELELYNLTKQPEVITPSPQKRQSKLKVGAKQEIKFVPSSKDEAADEVVDKPKKPVNPFVQFLKDNVQRVMKEENLKYHDGIKKCGEIWKQLDESQKLKYRDMVEEDKKRFDREMDELN